MNQIDKIKAEIEQLKESMKGLEPHSDFRRGQIAAYNQVLSLFDTLQVSEVDLGGKVTFGCISKQVTMTIQELINYYIDTECAETAEECGF